MLCGSVACPPRRAAACAGGRASYLSFNASFDDDRDVDLPILISRNRHVDVLQPLLRELEDVRSQSSAGSSVRFARMEDAFPDGFEWSDISRHPAIVLIPCVTRHRAANESRRDHPSSTRPTHPTLGEW